MKTASIKTKPIKGEQSRLSHLRPYDFFSFYSSRSQGVYMVKEATSMSIIYKNVDTNKARTANFKLKDRPVKLWTDIVQY